MSRVTTPPPSRCTGVSGSNWTRPTCSTPTEGVDQRPGSGCGARVLGRRFASGVATRAVYAAPWLSPSVPARPRGRTRGQVGGVPGPSGRCRSGSSVGLFRAHADRAVEAYRFAVEHRVLDDVCGQIRVLLGVAEPLRVRHLFPERGGCLFTEPLEQWGVEQSRCDG